GFRGRGKRCTLRAREPTGPALDRRRHADPVSSSQGAARHGRGSAAGAAAGRVRGHRDDGRGHEQRDAVPSDRHVTRRAAIAGDSMPVGSVSRSTVAVAAALVAAVLAFTPLSAQRVENARLRWYYFHDQRAFPFNEIPAGAFQAAVREYRARWPAIVPPLAQPRADTAWMPLGPGNIPGLAIQSTGRLTAIAVHPSDPNVIYIGGAQGGVWKTTNGGANWTPLTDHECSLAMGWIVLDPVDPDIVYAATGEQHFSSDSYYGCGVLRSTDGGATWTQLGAEVFDVATTTSGGVRIARIVLDPRTAGSTANATLHVAADNGVWKSTDGGVSWTRTLAGGAVAPAPATDLVMHPSDPDVLYAALGRVAGDAANGVYRSTDAGTTWTKLDNGFPSADVGRINLAI